MVAAWTIATIVAAAASGAAVPICATLGSPDQAKHSGNLPACCPCAVACAHAGPGAIGWSSAGAGLRITPPAATRVAWAPQPTGLAVRLAGNHPRARAPPLAA
jgi:hypothetical protein